MLRLCHDHEETTTGHDVMHSAAAERWFRSWQKQPAPRLRIVGFPHAGGQAGMFADWAKTAGPEVEVQALALPGRASRFTEQPIDRMDAVLDSVTPLLERSDETPTVFFGHSMGGIVAFELVRRLRARKARLPMHLFLSSAPTPERLAEEEPLHVLPDVELVEKLRLLGGTEDAILAHPELVPILLPMVRADFQLLETWTSPTEAPLDLPITVFGGDSDESVTEKELATWQRHTRGRFALRMFPGDHFYLNGARAALVGAILSAIAAA